MLCELETLGKVSTGGRALQYPARTKGDIPLSTRALRAAFSHIAAQKMALPSRLVLLALANRHNQETGRCDPSLSRISEDTQLSERAVRGALRELEKLRLISTVERRLHTGRGRRNLTNRYRLKGGAQYAGRMGHNMPPKLEDTPSAFDDLAAVLEHEPEGGAQ